ncbi:hypothetical protein ACHQM5_008428 [Ranunculus cassubicifolius]
MTRRTRQNPEQEGEETDLPQQPMQTESEAPINPESQQQANPAPDLATLQAELAKRQAIIDSQEHELRELRTAAKQTTQNPDWQNETRRKRNYRPPVHEQSASHHDLINEPMNLQDLNARDRATILAANRIMDRLQARQKHGIDIDITPAERDVLNQADTIVKFHQSQRNQRPAGRTHTGSRTNVREEHLSREKRPRANNSSGRHAPRAASTTNANSSRSTNASNVNRNRYERSRSQSIFSRLSRSTLPRERSRTQDIHSRSRQTLRTNDAQQHRSLGRDHYPSISPPRQQRRLADPSPFTREIREADHNTAFRIPDLPIYEEESGDPQLHIQEFESKLILQQHDKALLCKLFPGTFQGEALRWYTSLASASIHSWHKFCQIFLEKFQHNRMKPKKVYTLLNVRQKNSETLTDFVKRFRQLVSQVDNPDDVLVIKAFKDALNDNEDRCYDFLQHRNPQSKLDLFRLVEIFNDTEEERLLRELRKNVNSKSATGFPKNAKERGDGQKTGQDRMVNSRGNNVSQTRARREPKEFTPLNVSYEDLIQRLQPRNLLKSPPKMNPDRAHQRDKSKYCKFHADFGHTTDECYNLKNQVEELVQKGSIPTYIKKIAASNNVVVSSEFEYIDAIFAQTDSVSNSQRKKQYNEKIQALRHINTVGCFNFASGLHTETWEELPVTFSPRDLVGVFSPHYDGVLITVGMGMKRRVSRMLADEGSGGCILYSNCYERLNLPQELIFHDNNLLSGFDGHKSKPIGYITLDVSLMGKVLSVDFALMDCKSPFNGILGRTWTHPMEAIASSLYQCVKFPHNGRVAKVRSDQRAAYTCNETAFEDIKPSPVKDGNVLSITEK